MAAIGQMFKQTVIVKTLLGQTSTGPKYADPVSVACFINDGRKLVRDSTGQETVSETTLFAALSAAPDALPVAGQFAPGSQVAVNGRTTHVLTCQRLDAAGPASIHHVQVALT